MSNGEHSFSMIENFSSSLNGEALMDLEGGYAKGPERALLSALLFDGVQCFMSYAYAESATAKKRYSEGYNWVMNNSQEYIFSFENVCEALGINPEFVRLGLINIYNSQTKNWKKKRRNF